MRVQSAGTNANRTHARAGGRLQILALQYFAVTINVRFTPDDPGVPPHNIRPLKDPTRFADFCARFVRRFEVANILVSQ